MRVILVSVFFFFSASGRAQLSDTTLFTMFASPFYYNVLKLSDGVVIAGTSDGMYRMEGSLPKKINEKSGYVTVNKDGKPVIDSNGIKYHDDQSMLHLLPFSNEVRSEYHTGNEEFFYITSAGKMHVYNIFPYALQYRNHSVRTISRQFVGTYSGIYFKGKRLQKDIPTFCDGHIREFNNKYFICFSGLLICEPATTGDQEELLVKPVPSSPIVEGHVTDVHFSSNAGEYYVTSTAKLGIMDSSIQHIRTIFSSKKENEEVVFLGEDSSRGQILFACGAQLNAYSYGSRSTLGISALPEQILDAHITRLNYYLLTRNGLYIRHADNRIEKVAELTKAHTLLSISSTELAIASDNGLFVFNSIKRSLTRLIPGVEFNRRGLFVENGRLYAGSISGLYVFDVKQLDKIATSMNATASSSRTPGWFPVIAVALLLLLVLLLTVLVRYRKKIDALQTERILPEPEKPKLTREEIEMFIRENLISASLNSITDKFKINTSTVYALLEPDKPGAIIQELRMTKVKMLRKEGATAKDIAEVTGLSASYIRKIWNRMENEEME